MTATDKVVDVDIWLYDLEDAVAEHGLNGPMVWAKSIIDAVPEEFRHAASISFEYAGEGAWEFSLTYRRPATDAERQQDEIENRKREDAEHRSEYEQYQRLKAKYG